MRKRFLLLMVPIAIFSFSTSAQIKKGAHFIGGSFNFSFQNTDVSNEDFKNNSVQFSPAYGRAIKDNLIIGGDVVLAAGKTETVNFDYKNNAFGAGVFMRKYLPLGKGFYAFGQGRFGAVYSTQEYDYPISAEDHDINAFNVSLGFYPGISYAINNKFHIETGLNDLFYLQYSQETTEYNSFKSKKNSFSLGSNLSTYNWLTVGFRIILN